MKAIKVVDDPEKFKLLADDTRRKIVFLLRATEMTVSQIASTLEVTPQAIYHHIKKLQEADLVQVTREKRVGHLIESYFRATAEAFLCSVGSTPSGREFFEKQMGTALDSLVKIGFDLELTRTICRAVTIPVIASGGVGNLQHLVDGVKDGEADAVLAASIFHFAEFSIEEAKRFMADQGVEVRL